MTVENNPGAAQPAAAGSPGAAASSGGTLTIEAIQGLLTAALAPLQSEIATLKNASAAAKRVGQKTEPAKRTIDPSKIEDPEARTAYEETQRELRELRERDAARSKREEETALESALDSEIKKANPTNADVFKQLLKPHLRRSSDDPTVLIIDDGSKAAPLTQAVKDLSMRDMFRPASAGNGSGAAGDQGAGGAGASNGAKGYTAADIEKMTAAEFEAVSAAVGNGSARFAD